MQHHDTATFRARNFCWSCHCHAWHSVIKLFNNKLLGTIISVLSANRSAILIKTKPLHPKAAVVNCSTTLNNSTCPVPLNLWMDWITAVSMFPWTSLIYVSSPKCVYMCVKRCASQTPNAFICVSPNAFICVSPNAFICVSPNAFICVSPNAFICVSPNVSAESATELASLAFLCSLRSHVFLTI